MNHQRAIVRTGLVDGKIREIRGHRVLLDADLSELYGVATKTLNRAVRRNRARFPGDFMFPLTLKEFLNLRCQIGTSSWGGRRHLPMAFTGQGVAMLSSVLRSPRAVKVNVEIMRAFVRVRRLLGSNAEIIRMVTDLKRDHEARFDVVFEALRQLMEPPGEEAKERIGFRPRSRKR